MEYVTITVLDSKGSILAEVGRETGYGWERWAEALKAAAMEVQYGPADDVFKDESPVSFRLARSSSETLGEASQWDFPGLLKRLKESAPPVSLAEKLIREIGPAHPGSNRATIVFAISPSPMNRYDLLLTIDTVGASEDFRRIYKGSVYGEVTSRLKEAEDKEPQPEFNFCQY